MIKVVAKSTIQEDKIEEYKKIVAGLIAETRKEEGCLVYELFQDVNNSNIFTFIEEWTTREALQNHMKSRHFTEAMPKLNEIRAKESEVNLYTLFM